MRSNIETSELRHYPLTSGALVPLVVSETGSFALAAIGLGLLVLVRRFS